MQTNDKTERPSAIRLAAVAAAARYGRQSAGATKQRAEAWPPQVTGVRFAAVPWPAAPGLASSKWRAGTIA